MAKKNNTGGRGGGEPFLKNGGLLLQKLFSSFNGKVNPIRSYSLQELNQATDNYSTSLIFDRWKYSEWYKGSLQGRLISVRKFHQTDLYDDLLERVIKEIAFSSRMSTHKNVLKLLGCCLDTKIPTLVYEFPGNGVPPLPLSHVICNTNSLPWKNRLRIAWEIANVIAFLHTAFPRPIIHRVVALSSFFLDQDGITKLSNFFLSIALPEGEQYVVDKVRGKLGFIAPEYIMIGRFTEKVDVYGFGKLMLELLSGKTLIELGRLAEDEGFVLPDYVEAHVDVGNLGLDGFVNSGILIPKGGGEGCDCEEQQMVAVANLALRCIRYSPEDRPTMVEVAKEIRRIQRFMTTS